MRHLETSTTGRDVPHRRFLNGHIGKENPVCLFDSLQVLSNDAINFIPLLALFTKLTAVSHDMNESAAEESMDHLAVAATNQSLD
jgi:hypothetical protein